MKQSCYSNKVVHLINDDDSKRGGAQKILSLLENGNSIFFTLKNGIFKNKVIVLIEQLIRVVFSNAIKQCDVVYIHSRCYLPFSLVFRIRGVNTVFYTHACYRKNKFLFKLFPCDFYIAVSNAVKNNLILSGIKENTITVISNPLLLSNSEKQKKNIFYKNKVGSVGRLEEWKGFTYAINALNKCTEDKMINYKIIGAGSLHLDLQKQAEKLSNVNLELLGHQDKPFDVLNNTPIILIPSLEEGFGLIAIEAIFSGKIVLYSDIPALDEICNQDELSFSFNTASINSFNKAYQKAILCESKFNDVTLYKNRRDKILNNYGIKSFYEKHSDFINNFK